MKQLAMMNVNDGEEIAGMYISGEIRGTGSYKLLAKKKTDGTFEWVHFVERANGNKENVHRGDVGKVEQLTLVLNIMNKNLIKTFGSMAEMKQAIPNIKNILSGEDKEYLA